MKSNRRARIDTPDELTKAYLDRRGFLKQVALLSGGTAAASAWLARWGSNVALGEFVAKDDPRLDVGYITYPGETGDIRAYAARPKGEEPCPAVVIVHENTGLQPHFEDVARRFALEGFHAIAPDALSPLGGTPAGSTSQATSLLNQLNYQATVKNFVAAVQYLQTHPLTTGKVGCTGFCWGGAMTNQVAVNAPDLTAAVPFYGAQPAAADVPKIKASLLCHYGALDNNINAGIVAYEAALKAAGIDYGIYIHKGAQHAFFNDTKTDRYHPAAADLAWRLTLAFFQAKLRDDRLAAHYRLDEAEGAAARDSVGGHDGTLYGGPVWQPGGGQIKGALQLDGIDDYLGTGFVLDPVAGPFSAFAWVRGGAPGQAIIAQAGGANWLSLDAEGKLMTTLSRPAGGRQGPASSLVSPSQIVDGAWHHVGVVWDGTNRALYVDNVLVGEDAQGSLVGCNGGLNIGAGPNLEPGTFFTGLIDDVRIYHQAVRP
jgi:carboxymethylenebutenolidase